MPKTPLLKCLRVLHGEIPLDAVQPDPNATTTKQDFKTLTAYNLLPKAEQRMVVPGSPSTLTPTNTPQTLKPDAGKYFRDANNYIFPKFPLEPIFRALLVLKPNFKLDGIDFITDRRNLRLLLGLVGGSRKPFRIDVTVINSTVLFTTWSPNKVDFVNKFDGYGREFEKRSTQNPPCARRSITHNRIVSYTLGGVKILLRFEVDACTPSKRNRKWPKPSNIQTPHGFTITNMGSLIDPSRIVEIKTGRVGKRLDIPKVFAQMWFSETPILYMGNYQEGGRFDEITELNAVREGKLKKWEEDNQDKIRKLIRLLQLIGKAVQGAAYRVSLVYEGDTVLKVYRDDSPVDKSVPKDLLTMWNTPNA